MPSFVFHVSFLSFFLSLWRYNFSSKTVTNIREPSAPQTHLAALDCVANEDETLTPVGWSLYIPRNEGYHTWGLGRSSVIQVMLNAGTQRDFFFVLVIVSRPDKEPWNSGELHTWATSPQNLTLYALLSISLLKHAPQLYFKLTIMWIFWV